MAMVPGRRCGARPDPAARNTSRTILPVGNMVITMSVDPSSARVVATLAPYSAANRCALAGSLSNTLRP